LKEETRELDAKDTAIIGNEAAGVPVSELPQRFPVKDVGGPPQEIGISEKGGTEPRVTQAQILQGVT
jgi:hypothetical protein